MKMILPVILAAGMMASGLASAAQPQPNGAPTPVSPQPMLAGAGAASEAATGGISTGKVIAYSIAAVATAGVIYGVSQGSNNKSKSVTPGTTGTTGTH